MTHTCAWVYQKQFRSRTVELVRDMGIGADVCVCGRHLQDEPSRLRVLWHALTVQRLQSGCDKTRMNYSVCKEVNSAGTDQQRKLLYLFAHRAVVVGVQNLDFHNSLSGEDAVTGGNVKKIIVFLFAVQRLSDRDLPLVLNVLDCKLAKRVPSFKEKRRKWLHSDQHSCNKQGKRNLAF